MNLLHLFGALPGATIVGNSALEISGVAFDSRRVLPGDVFVAVPGLKHNGLGFVPEAVARGAVAVVAQAGSGDETSGGKLAAWVQVPNARLALALSSSIFYGAPSEQLKLFGITGTNGKTTVSYLLASMLAYAGWEPALFGTIAYQLRYGRARQPKSSGQLIPAPNTTPESLDLQRMLREVVDGGGRSAVMEVSSHALALDRVAGCSFHAAVFTNFSRDHMDFHESMENYFAAKAKLFSGYKADASSDLPALKPPGHIVLNADDPRSVELRRISSGTISTYGLAAKADVSARRFKSSRKGLEFTAETTQGPIEVRSTLVGKHNVYNLLAAIAAAQTLGIETAQISESVKTVTVPGRMEMIEEGQPFGVFVDYAHTDDALTNILRAVREWSGEGRIILIFGCGGDRDRTKRPLMGAAAGAADKVILTSDNPRGEDPLRILNDVVVGLQKVRADYTTEPDRARAIHLGLTEARQGDIVLIAGKGHEKYQLIGNERLPFDDSEVARAALRRLGFEAS